MSLEREGFEEIEHTADWELSVWAEDFPGLLSQAARGMYSLAGIKGDKSQSSQIEFEITADDAENMLVSFLSELLYFLEKDGLVVDDYDLDVQGQRLRAKLRGSPVCAMQKEIKAVTYHNLKIDKTPDGYQTRIVFDV